MQKKLRISLLLACLISHHAFAVGDASQALQTIQWATAEVGNAVGLAKKIEQIALATQSLQQNIQAVQIAQQNLQALNAIDVSNFNNYIDQLANSMVATNGIAYNMSNLDDKFSVAFPGYDAHIKRGMNGSIKDQSLSYSEYYKSLTDQNRGTALGTLRNLRATNQDLQDDAVNINMLKLQSRNAVGNKAVVQAANEIALHQTDTLKKLHSTMLLQTNLMVQATAQQNEEKAASQASHDAWVAASKRPIKGNEPHIKTW